MNAYRHRLIGTSAYDPIVVLLAAKSNGEAQTLTRQLLILYSCAQESGSTLHKCAQARCAAYFDNGLSPELERMQPNRSLRRYLISPLLKPGLSGLSSQNFIAWVSDCWSTIISSASLLMTVSLPWLRSALAIFLLRWLRTRTGNSDFARC